MTCRGSLPRFPQSNDLTDLPMRSSLNCGRHFQSPVDLPYCVPPSLITLPTSAGILTCCPSTTLFGLVLGPTNPGMINIAQETLGFRRTIFHPFYRYLCRHNLFCFVQRSLRSAFNLRQNAPLPLYLAVESAASVICFSPVIFSAQARLTSELLRFL